MSGSIIRNVNVFDGYNVKGNQTIVFSDGIISEICDAEEFLSRDGNTFETEIDGCGCTLLPGLFDCHIHLNKPRYLDIAARHGVTALVDCGTRTVEQVRDQLNLPGHPEVLSTYIPIYGPDSVMRTRMLYGEDARVNSIEDVPDAIDYRIRIGAAFIKVILEVDDNKGGVDFPDDILVKIVEESHRRGIRVHAHATSMAAYAKGARAGVDMISHMPFDKPVPEEILADMKKHGTVCIPTLVMMEGILNAVAKRVPHFPIRIESSLNNLAAIKNAGIKVLAGTDANLEDPTTPFHPCHGPSLHREMMLMTRSGFEPIEVLRSATSDPAAYFGLEDRGVIAVGKRADLVLVQGDPTVDMDCIRNIYKVWINGLPVS